MSGIYFALIGAKKYAASLPERTDSFWPNKVSFFVLIAPLVTGVAL